MKKMQPNSSHKKRKEATKKKYKRKINFILKEMKGKAETSLPSDTFSLHLIHYPSIHPSNSSDMVSVPACGCSVSTSHSGALSITVGQPVYANLSLWFGLRTLSFHHSSMALSGQRSDNGILPTASFNRSPRELFSGCSFL